MIVLDTHAWIWWIEGGARLSAAQREAIGEGEQTEIGVSVVSCWEVAMLVALGRLALTRPTRGWVEEALTYPGVRVLGLTPEIAVASTELPEPFHRDPADRFLVATARASGSRLVTSDRKILAYPHVETVG